MEEEEEEEEIGESQRRKRNEKTKRDKMLIYHIHSDTKSLIKRTNIEKEMRNESLLIVPQCISDNNLII